MNEDTQLTRRDTRMARIWQMLIDLDEAISTSPLEKSGAPMAEDVLAYLRRVMSWHVA